MKKIISLAMSLLAVCVFSANAQVQSIPVDKFKLTTGVLKISSEPSEAPVFLDGRLVGKTPLFLPHVFVGEHKIEIETETQSAKKTVFVKENETKVVHLVLQDKPSDELEFAINGVTFKMILVEGGTFRMGATSEQGSVYDDEKPAHEVTLSDYYIGQTEVTQELWEAVMGSNPSKFKGNSRNPVEQVSWNDVVNVFLPKLNALTGMTFTLPTEAQWEFVARGGNKRKGYKYSGSNNIDEVAWYADNSNDKTHPVGQKLPNELRIYDMSGNVWEWCSDWYGNYTAEAQIDPTGPASGGFHVLRGGDYSTATEDSYIACRNFFPDDRHFGNGFRLVLNGTDHQILVTIPDYSQENFYEKSFTVNGVTFKMIPVEGGSFTMGATSEQGDDVGEDEKPAHKVILSDYYIGQTEVTQELWEAVMGSNPSYHKYPNNPVESVSWYDIVYGFLPKLNAITGKTFTLPTEAQWEYAARGGNESEGYMYSGSDIIYGVSCCMKSTMGYETAPVGAFDSNELGLYDMSGNVSEWCHDWAGPYSAETQADPTGPSSGSCRVLRGGSYRQSGWSCRVSARFLNNAPDERSDLYGFRLVLNVSK